MNTILIYGIIFVILIALELVYFKIADTFNIIDKPNERSSHSTIVLRGGVKLLAVANNISDNEAMDKYSGKLFVVGIIVFVILMCVIGNNDDGFN